MVLASTMWDGGEDHQHIEREEELSQHYWGVMKDRGSQYQRFMNTQQSAWSILNPLIDLSLAQRATRADTALRRSFPTRAKGLLMQLAAIIKRVSKVFGREAGEGRDSAIAEQRPDQDLSLHIQLNPGLIDRRTSHFSQNDCHSLLLDIAKSDAGRKALCTLRSDEAQVMVDYLNLVRMI